MKIPKKYSILIFGAIMGAQMGFFMSFIITVLAIGFAPNFFQVWMTGFAVALVVGVPVSLILAPFAKKIVDRISD
ncbi:MAG: DUF2798 domain-containing protein [Nitrosopumilaceae archaeon]